MQTRIVSDALYFVTFIDDRSRKVWGFALKTKYHVLDALKELHVRLERETKLKVVREDNGGEYRVHLKVIANFMTFNLKRLYLKLFSKML